MSEEIVKLFCYKGKDILIKKKNGKFYIGVRDKLDIWFDKIVYNSLKLARTSGREYARIVIDKMQLSRK